MEGLLPRTTYDFRFAARNAVGFGEYSPAERQTMPEEGPPEEPPIITNENQEDNIVTVPYPRRYQLLWTAPPSNGKPINKFEVTYYKVSK